MDKVLSNIIQEFNDRIAALGMSRLEFSRVSGISYETLRRLDNPTLHTLRRIDEALARLGG